LPHTVLNYLLLLGWSLDDTTEFFTREEMIERFSLERVNKAPASFDPKAETKSSHGAALFAACRIRDEPSTVLDF
jgi:glutamyl-tRNA synthetase